MNLGKYIEMYSEDLTLKGYSKNTIKNYVCQVELFLKKHSELATKPTEISEQQIKSYLLQFKTRNSIAHALSALKLFYRLTVRQPMKLKHIEYPKRERKLPKVIDKDRLIRVISSIQNLKHKAILTLAFSTGMRVSEVCDLEFKDVDSERMLILIRNAKGAKDRFVPLSQNCLNTLRSYFRQYRPKKYLFEGQFGGKYTPTSCNQVVKKHLGNEAHFHLLRHSCFTTLLETGTDLRIIQKIAGHANSKTSEIYTHVSKQLLNRVALPI